MVCGHRISQHRGQEVTALIANPNGNKSAVTQGIRHLNVILSESISHICAGIFRQRKPVRRPKTLTFCLKP